MKAHVLEDEAKMVFSQTLIKRYGFDCREEETVETVTTSFTDNLTPR